MQQQFFLLVVKNEFAPSVQKLYRMFHTISTLMTSIFVILFFVHYCSLVVHGIPSSILNTSESSSSLENKQHVEVNSKTAFHVLIDSGSTGSRIYIYQYEEDNPLKSLVEVAHKRVRPALSTFYEDYRGLKKQLKELIKFAESYVSRSKRSRTSLSLQATAGLRIMPNHEQEWLISQARRILGNSSFAVNPLETRVLTGGEEALFGLLATNAAFGDLSLHSANGLTLGAADLGGSSQQIAFMLPRRNFSWKTFVKQLSWNVLLGKWPQPYPKECKPDYRLAINGSDQFLEVFARSVPSLGLVEAMRDTLYEISEHYQTNPAVVSFSQRSQEEIESSKEKSIETALLTPLATVASNGNVYVANSAVNGADIEITKVGENTVVDAGIDRDEENSKETLDSIVSSNMSITNIAASLPLYNPCVSIGERYPYPEDLDALPWVGTGDFHECVRLVKTRLQHKASSEMSCLKSLTQGDSASSNNLLPTIVAMDNFPKVLEVLKLANDTTVTPLAIKEAGIRICQQSWTDILAEFPDFFPFRAHQACFGASYIYAITTELYGLDELDNTSFFPTDNHHSYTVGWPLGSTIYSAMKWTFEEMSTEGTSLDHSISS